MDGTVRVATSLLLVGTIGFYPVCLLRVDGWAIMALHCDPHISVIMESKSRNRRQTQTASMSEKLRDGRNFPNRTMPIAWKAEKPCPCCGDTDDVWMFRKPEETITKKCYTYESMGVSGWR